jgi:hypothetical protein
MKTIEIQNCTDYRDNMFKIFVNGEKHILRYKSKIQMPDDKPFEIRARYFWDGSPKYTFEPNDNMVLQVLANQRLMDRYWRLIFFAWILTMVASWVFGSGLFHDISFILCLFLLMLLFIIKRRKTYIIQEIKKDKKYEND